jgi:hypothetical protein
MMERRQIVRLWQQGGTAVLVTLVRAEGSSYRRPGARLLLGAVRLCRNDQWRLPGDGGPAQGDLASARGRRGGALLDDVR